MSNHYDDTSLYESINSTAEKLGQPIPAGFYPLSPELEGVLRVTMEDTSTVHPALLTRSDFQKGTEIGRARMPVIDALKSLKSLKDQLDRSMK